MPWFQHDLSRSTSTYLPSPMLLDGRLEAWIAVSAMNVLDALAPLLDSLAGLDITEVSSTSMEDGRVREFWALYPRRASCSFVT